MDDCYKICAFIIGSILVFWIGVIIIDGYGRDTHYQDTDNYREITVIWKEESIVDTGGGCETGYFIGTNRGDIYRVRFEDYMIMGENETHLIVKDYYYSWWSIIDQMPCTGVDNR